MNEVIKEVNILKSRVDPREKREVFIYHHCSF